MATCQLIILLALLIFINFTPATGDCVTDPEEKVCMEAGGFYFLLGNGTWNVSLTEGDALSERETFLKYLESDNCDVAFSVNASKPDGDYCHCKLGVPFPRHPITQGLLLHDGLRCKQTLQHSLHPGVWHPLWKQMEQCMFLGPIHFPFLCVFNYNLKEMVYTYNNPPALKKRPHYDDMRRKRSYLSWRNASATAAKAEIKTRSSVNSSAMLNVSQERQTTPNENGTALDAPIQVKLLNGTTFRVRTDNETEVDHVTVDQNTVNNRTIYFSAPTECLRRYRKWDVFPLCSYTIDVSNVTDCTDLRMTFRVASSIIFQHMASLDTQVIIEEPSWDSFMESIGNMDNETLGEGPYDETTLTCEKFPTRLSAIEMWAEGKHLATILSFETEDFVSVVNELRLTGVTSQKIVSEEEYTGLSRFWAKFHFGDCLYRQCWRDLWNVVPPDMLQSSQSIVGNEDDGYFRLRFLMPIFILCFVLLVRNCIVNSEDVVGLE